MQDRKIVELPIEDVLPNRFQPRIKFDESSINELATSVKRYGVIQPIVVRQIGTKYEIIAGERRYKASVLAGKKTIPAIITNLSDKDSVEIALIENVQREDLTPIEKAISYKKILDIGYITQEQLAEKVGKSQSAIANSLRLLNLSDEAQEALLENKISERHARSLLKLRNNNDQVKMLNRIITERLTVRKTDEEISKMIGEENNINTISSMPQTNNDNLINIPDIPVIDNPNSSLPGFMNIDNIQNNATDINVEVTKPDVDMSQLLASESTSVVNDIPAISQDSNLHNNKFFNFFDEQSDDNNDGDSKEIPVVDVPTIEEPTFNVPSIPTIEEPTFEVPSVPTIEEPTFEVPSVPTIEEPTFEIPSVPTIEEPSFNVPNVPTIEEPTFNVPSVPTIEEPTFNVPSVPTIEEPTFNVPSVPTIEEPTFEVPNVPTIEEPSFNVPSVPTIEEPTFNVPSVPTIDEQVSKNQEVELPTSIPDEVEIIPSIDVAPLPKIDTYVDDTPVFNNVEPLENTFKPNIKQALDVIRECESKLNSLGFVVDAEELDLPDNYQVTFKIQK